MGINMWHVQSQDKYNFLKDFPQKISLGKNLKYFLQNSNFKFGV